MPSAVLGHSVGELAACCVAGIFTVQQAISLAYHLGPEPGAMLHTELKRKQLEVLEEKGEKGGRDEI